MSNLILSKESSESEIKRYFNAVLELSKSDNEFPINLDDVWPLVYTEKGRAVKSLKENFIEEIDYQVFDQNVKNPSGGRPTITYHLTLSCMEFFIARKVRPVFDVYREVFHRVATMHTPPVPASQDRAQRVKELQKIINVGLAEGLSEASLRPVAENLARCIASVDELEDVLGRLRKPAVPTRQAIVLGFLGRYGISIDTEDPYAQSYDFYKQAWDEHYERLLGLSHGE